MTVVIPVQRVMRGVLWAAALGLLLAVSPAARAESEKASQGETEFRAGWTEFTKPVTGKPNEATPEVRQLAREAAIPHLEAAVAADPDNVAYHTALAHVCLAAGKYRKGLEAANQAIKLERGDPLLYLLRGQAEAALAQLNAEEDSRRVGRAMTAFSRAAELDPKNALPLFQAASVAIDLKRPDLVEFNLGKALSRPECRLYQIPVPEDLGDSPAASLKAWEYAQYGNWIGLVARCRNVADYLLRRGKQEEEKGELAAAADYYQKVRDIAARVGTTEPRLFITVNTAIDMLEDAYGCLARAAEAAGDEQARRWEGEKGICGIARQQLFGALKTYQDEVSAGKIGTVEQSLKRQAELVSPMIAGVGLPTGESPAASNGSREVVAGRPPTPHQE